MSVSYKDLKSKTYLQPTKAFLESHLGIRFTHKSLARCPFHDDRHASFGMYLDDENGIRFHCLANCKQHSHWDIYDLIMLKERCSFREAQERFAKFIGIEDFEFHRGRITASYDEPSGDSKETEEPILETDAEELTDRHKEALLEAADFYNRLLTDRKDKFERAWKYLSRRGLDEGIVEKFKIGFCPALEDEEYRGRAFLYSHLDEFMKDVPSFQIFNRLSLFLLLNQPDSPMYQYHKKHIDYGAKHAYGVYSDYFAGRITFPIFNRDGQAVGMIGRRLDNRGVRWKKQSQEDSVVSSKGWLYRIDKSAAGIKEYQTAIIVEGIFDFFAFYNISESKEKPIVISTLGTSIDESAVQLLKELGAKHLIIAFDRDEAGIRGIQRAATEIKGLEISFLGSLKGGEDPADRLKGVLGNLSNFGIRHLQEGMKVKSSSGRPVMASFLVQKEARKRQVQEEILLKPASAVGAIPLEPPVQKDKPKDFWDRIDSIIHLLSYNHGNRAELEKALQQIISILSDPQKEPPSDEERSEYFRLPNKFIEDEHHIRLRDALILHLRLAVEQQTKRRKGGVGGRIKESDTTIAGWLQTSARTIQKYKSQLKEAGLLNIEVKGITQELSVNYFKKTEPQVTPTKAV